MNHFLSIGYNVEGEESVKSLLDSIQSSEDHKTSSFPGGHYIIENDASGSEVWVGVDNKNNLLSLTPAFLGTSERSVDRVKLIKGRGDPYSVSYTCHPVDDGSVEEFVDYPMIFEVPNYLQLGKPKPGEVYKVSLVAFPMT